MAKLRKYTYLSLPRKFESGRIECATSFGYGLVIHSQGVALRSPCCRASLAPDQAILVQAIYWICDSCKTVLASTAELPDVAMSWDSMGDFLQQVLNAHLDPLDAVLQALALEEEIHALRAEPATNFVPGRL